MRYPLIFLIIIFLASGCDPLARPVTGDISFSSDTVRFDTVFTSSGTVTREFRAVNRHREAVRIDRIRLAGAGESPFRLNVNGIPGNDQEGAVLAAGDSIFIFVDAMIDPNGGTLPVAVYDSVIFESGAFSGSVLLEAWGQDIYIVDHNITGDSVWTAGRPHVIDGTVLVEAGASLTLQPGAKVYFHNGAALDVAGRLVSSGTALRPVLFATDRTDSVYIDRPGRWKGITFLPGSSGNEMTFTEVRNAIMAVKIQGASDEPDLLLYSARVIHNSVASLVASMATVKAVNTLFSHSGFSTVNLSSGGTFEFIHCTLFGLWEYAYRTEPVMKIWKGEGVIPGVRIINSVITGNLAEEMTIDATAGEVTGKIEADSSMIKAQAFGADWFQQGIFNGVTTAFVPLFIDAGSYDFRPDTLSPLIDRARMSESSLYPSDIRDKPRPTGSGSDIGAYERQPGEKRKEL